MTIAALIRATELLSTMLVVFGFGLRSTLSDATYLFRNPLLLVRSLLAMNVVLPLFAASLVAVFGLRPAIGIVLVAVALSPVPPFLPREQLKLVAHQEYVFGLFGASSLLAIVLAPLMVAVIAVLFTRNISIGPSAIAKTVALSVLIPFAGGMIVRRMSVGFAERASPVAGTIGILLLVVALTPVLINAWPALITLYGNGTVAALVAFTVVGLTVGHLFGGPISENRTVLALATASRHPGVALAMATQIYPDQKLIAPAVLFYLIVSAIASTPYTLWRVHSRKNPGSTPS
jgi:BASS family bile acid:Na+ symporter